MVKMKPPKVYIHEMVYESEFTKKRLDKMMENIETDDLQIVDDASFEEIVKTNNWSKLASKRTGEIKRESDPTIIFNNFRFLPEDAPLRDGHGQIPCPFPAERTVHPDSIC